MPLYEVEHIVPLTSQQKDALAQAITRVHSELFVTPRLLVNIRFTDVSTHETYMAGLRYRSNRIIGFLRPGRPQEQLDELVVKLGEHWDRVVFKDGGGAKEFVLGGTFINATLVAGQEKGLMMPPGGTDRQWLKDNMATFRRLADQGDEQCKDLLREVEERGLV